MLIDKPGARLEGLQCLRAIAALMVLVAHVALAVPGLPRISIHSAGGWGVDVFFVISGYVIALASQRKTAGRFLSDRLWRVLPPYLIFSFLAVALDPESAKRALRTLLFLPAFDFGTYRDPAHWFGWSIGIELWFYLLFASCLLTRRPVVLFVATLTILVAVATAYSGHWILPKFIGSPITLEFAGGVLLQRVAHRVQPRHAVAALLLGLALVALTVVPFYGFAMHGEVIQSPAFAWQRLAFWGLPAWLVVAAVVGADLHGLVRCPAWLVKLGDASYSLYLVQPLTIMLMWQLPWRSAWIVIPALFITTVLLGLLSRRFIEIPLSARFGPSALSNLRTSR